MNIIAPTITIEAIGVVRSDIQYRYESPRQGVLAGETTGIIKLRGGKNYEQALIGLDGFERIWVLFQFHLNPNWNPMVSPPRQLGKKVGVFATRSPHRPSGIGMSCVKLERITGKNIFISQCDILDGSPVIDIKPYLPYSDSFPSVKTGWVETSVAEKYEIIYTDQVTEKAEWLMKTGKINLKNYIRIQLEFDPINTQRKRITQPEGTDIYQLAYRTWRINYLVDNGKQTVTVLNIISGYTEQQLLDNDDRYSDKELHMFFHSSFPID